MARKLAVATTLLTTAAVALAGPAGAAADTVKVRDRAPTATSAGLLSGLIAPLVGTSGGLLGSVDPTGGVLTDAAGKVIGTFDAATGQILTLDGTLLGTVDPVTGLVLDPLGNVIGGLLGAGGGSGSGGTGGSTGAPGSPQTPTQPNGGGPLPLPLALALSASRSQRLVTVSRRGVSARTACSTACGVLAAVTIDGRTAKRLGLGNGVRPVVVGTTAATRQGSLPIRVSSRTRRALSAALPTTRKRRAVRSRRIRAQRAYRAARSARAKRSARRRYLRYRRQERRFIPSGRVKLTVAAVAVDGRGRTSTTRRMSLTVKR